VTAQPTESGDAEDTTLEFPHANIVAVRAIAVALASTLGPRSYDTLVAAEQADDSDIAPGTRTAGDVVVASDAATILERLPIQHPIAPVLRRMVGPERPGETGVEGEDMPDGTATRAVLAGALLDRAESLLERGLHPKSIIEGYERAHEIARDELREMRITFEEFPDPWEARVATARTAMTGNVPGGHRDAWARMVADAVDLVGMPDEEAFDVERTHNGSIDETRLVRGAVLGRKERADREMPRRVEDASVLVLDGHDRGGLQERDAPEGAAIELETPADMHSYEMIRRDRKEAIIERFVDVGVDIVVTRLGIDTDYQTLLADAGIMGIRSVSPLNLSRIARATGAQSVLDPTDLIEDDCGRAGHVAEIAVEPYSDRRKKRRIIVFEGCPDPASVTVLLRGVSDQIADQAATTVRKGAFAVGMAAMTDHRPAGVVPGGGAAHVRVADAVRDAATGVDSRDQFAMEAYADAAERVVVTLARNGGLDPIAAVPDIRTARETGTIAAGLVFPSGTVGNCLDAGVLDPLAVLLDAYLYATDVATLVLGIDDTIDAVRTADPVANDDVIYDEPAELQKRTLEERDQR
jgi:chaperonin GroEL (HSP60 family)